MSAPALRVYDRAVVVVPAHNEKANLPACLRAVLTAALCVPISVSIVVVLDASDDDSAKLAGEYGPDVHFVSVEAMALWAKATWPRACVDSCPMKPRTSV